MKLGIFTLLLFAAVVHAAPVPSSKKAAAPSAVSDEARRHLMRGRAAMKDAKDAAGFLDAAKEFEAAAAAAPGMPEALYNAGVAYEKAGDPASAMKQFKAYLDAAPKAKDARAVKDRIFELEYRAEKAADISGCWQDDDWENDATMVQTYGADWCRFVIAKTSGGSFIVKPFKERHALKTLSPAYSISDLKAEGRAVRFQMRAREKSPGEYFHI